MNDNVSNTMNQGNVSTDLVFCLNHLHLPTYLTPGEIAANQVTGERYLGNLQGDFSYKHIWATLYREAMILGSKLKLTIRKPLYPSELAKVYPSVQPKA